MSGPTDTYRTLAGPSRAEIKVKGSRFIAEAFPVPDADAAEARIAALRKREYNATHVCSAYRVGRDGQTFRYHDDGEPSGTAGAPILRQIEGRGLTNTLVAVTRYFGGTKLGTGGLVRAYGDAAAAALDGATLVERVVRVPVRLQFAYADTAPAMRTLEAFDAEIRETRYTDDTELLVAVRASEADALIARFIDHLAGRGRAERLEDEASDPEA